MLRMRRGLPAVAAAILIVARELWQRLVTRAHGDGDDEQDGDTGSTRGNGATEKISG